jgi:glycosyltransferase involved in cell wall biosynthesis
MKDHPFISIIVPNYNHAGFLKQRLESVFTQDFDDYEVILLDDHSTDNSMEILEEFHNHPKVAGIFRNEINGGHSILQWKKGIEKAKGEWIWIAESDDYCDAHFLKRLMDFANVNPDCAVVYCQSDDVDVEGAFLRSRMEYTKEFNPNIWKDDFAMDGHEFNRNFMKVKNVIPNASAVLFKRKWAESDLIFGPEILNMHYASDWFFWIRILQKGKIGFVSETMNHFREHHNSTRIQDNIDKIQKRLHEETIIRTYLLKSYPEINQDDEWEIIYSKWFSQQNGFPYFNYGFYFARKPDQTFWKYIRKFQQFRKRMKQHESE